MKSVVHFRWRVGHPYLSSPVFDAAVTRIHGLNWRHLVIKASLPGWPTLSRLVLKGWAALLSDAQKSQAHHRTRRSSLHYLLLLPAKAAFGLRSRQESCGANPQRSSRSLPLRPRWLRHHAGAPPLAHQRIRLCAPVHDPASLQVKTFAPHASKKTRAERSVPLAFSERGKSPTPFLATPLLRFQRLLARKSCRETSLHALQSGQRETCGPSRRLALEQLVLLLSRRRALGDGFMDSAVDRFTERPVGRTA